MLNLIRKLGRRAGGEAFSAPLEPGEGVIYAVGDVHGRHDLLACLLERILDDFRALAGAPAPPRVVFLGDYIDRGDGSRETIAALRDLARGGDIAPVFLMGNHEQMLLRFLREPTTGPHWVRNGGLQTLASYGIALVGSSQGPEDVAAVRDALREAMGRDLDFIESLRLCHHAGNVFFAHAGADPDIPTEEQDVQTLLWGSRRFGETVRADGMWVVHGHFVVDHPTAENGRIAVDTGAYFSGRLTAARIAPGDVRFIQS